MRIPFSLVAAEQKLSVDFAICFKLTTHLLRFIPNKIEFGTVFYSQNENPEKFETEEQVKLRKKRELTKKTKNQKKCRFCFKEFSQEALADHEEYCED
jgi:hypothetical protein